jgi:CRISPR-associated endonuclease Csn1
VSRRFSFDIGTNSIGWAVYALSHVPGGASPPTVTELLGAGVRLYDDGRNPKDGRSLAEMRRVPRASRRRRDRFVMRRATLLKQLEGLGLVPTRREEREAQAQLDPYRIRAQGLDRTLEPYEIGRALLHINQRRGFLSNRRADRKGRADDSGMIAAGIKRLHEEMRTAGARTVGELLWQRHGGTDGTATPRTRSSVRIRLEGTGNEALYRIYPDRRLLAAEFDTLMTTQAANHREILTPAAIEGLRETIFYQRKLKAPLIGRCTFVPTETRLPKALPSVEARVIYETLNHLRFGRGLTLDQRLTAEQRDGYAQQLLSGQNVTFKRLRADLDLPAHARISLEDAGKTDLKDYVAKSAGLAGRTRRGKPPEPGFGERWHEMPLDQRDAVVAKLIDSDDEAELTSWLMAEHGLSSEAAACVAARMPAEGYSRLGPTANGRILAELKAGDMPTYAEAVKRSGWHHSDERDGVIELPLPYYGQVLERHVIGGDGISDDTTKRYGRFPNPTAHVALNQLRRVVNLLVREYGEPAQIVLELARDLKLNREQKDREQQQNRQNRSIRERHRQILQEHRQIESGDNFLRLRLYEEQERSGSGVARCPFTLNPISVAELFSPAIEIEHLLPYSRTLDDSAANKVLCFRETNRQKRARTPHEAFGSAASWPDIEAAAQTLPPNKRWRFAPDAMQRYETAERSFLARQLNETRHLSRMARFYLTRACHPDHVYVTTGQLTAMLRARWGLNSIWREHNQQAADQGSDTRPSKGRTDHRHHAVDAIVIGAIDRSLLQLIARRAGQAEAEDRQRIAIEAVPEEPFVGFRDAVRAAVERVVVSLKPEHGVGGALHEDTAYGVVKNEHEAKEIGSLVVRKLTASLSPKEVDAIRDPRIRADAQAAVAPFRDANGRVTKGSEKAYVAALEAFSRERAPGREQGVRHVRIGKAEAGAVLIKDRKTGAAYKALVPGENHHVDIVQMQDGTWRGFAASVFDVNQKGWRPEWEAKKMGGKLVMRLHKGDAIEVNDLDGQRRIKIVHRIEISNSRVRLAAHNEGGKLQERHEDPNDPFRWDFANIPGLKGRRARKVKIDAIGNTKSARSNVS